MVTLKDVAVDANVSVAVASRVLGNYGYVSEEKRKCVIDSAEKLGYKSNLIARGLRTRATFCIGVVISDITTNYFTLAVRGIDDIASQNGYHLIVCNSDEKPEKEKIQLEELVSRSVDGIIICPTSGNISLIKKIIRVGIPVVIIDRKFNEIDTFTITVDNILGSLEAVTHLIENGYRHIGIVKGPEDIISLKERYEGYLMALKNNDIAFRQELVEYGRLNTDESLKCTRRLLDLEDPPDAIFVVAESMIVGTLMAIQEKKLRIGNDIGVVVFDDPPWASIISPPLTCVRQSSYRIGTIAAQTIIAKLHNKEIKSKDNTHFLFLRPQLIVRESGKKKNGL